MTTRPLGRRGLSALVLLIVAALPAIIVLQYFRGPDRASFLAENERVLSRLPRPAGVREVFRQELAVEKPLFGEQLSHTVGYTTHVTYSVPRQTTQQKVVGFYSRRLSDWRETSWTVNGTLFACFDRRGVTVSIATEGLDPDVGTVPKSYSVSVDHDGGSCD